MKSVSKTVVKEAEFEPVIVAFCCNWCAYAGADLAGTSRFEYPANVRVIRVMCSARVSPIHILSALRWGADGVLIAGCHPGDCHYVKGNFAMEKRFTFLKEVANRLGIDPARIRLEWISASEGGKFAALIRDVTTQIKDLGPSPLPKRAQEIEAAIEAYKRQRLRWIFGVSQTEAKLDEEKYRAAVDTVMKDEIERQMIIRAIKQRGPLTIREISDAITISPDRILRHIIALRKTGVVSEAGEKEDGYLYAVS